MVGFKGFGAYCPTNISNPTSVPLRFGQLGHEDEEGLPGRLVVCLRCIQSCAIGLSGRPPNAIDRCGLANSEKCARRYVAFISSFWIAVARLAFVLTNGRSIATSAVTDPFKHLSMPIKTRRGR